MAGRYVKVGTVLNVLDKKTDEMKKTIKLGQDPRENGDPKYEYTVQIRIFEGSPRTKEELQKAKVITVLTNPWVNLNTPHEKAPKSIVNELQVYIPE